MKTTIYTRYSSQPSIVEPELHAHSGQPVEVLGEVPEDTIDTCCVGPMFRIRFADGYESEAFIDELEPEPATAWTFDESLGEWVNPR
jgi:hypothetical protein